ncbi:MAG: diadenylate cyclase CdaA [Lachnospiraceae bacterium]|nr:diadenylate cyclase CdaA [Lachnospiraceae bacterium]
MSIYRQLRHSLSGISFPKIGVVDVIEIIILAFAIYHIIKWVKQTKAWELVRGIVVLAFFYLVAYLLRMDVILWIFNKTIALGITAIVIVFQPELRRALEQLGQKNIITVINPFEDSKEKNLRFSNRTLNEIVKASAELAKVNTGALIIIERDINLYDYERTGINIDAVVTSQLLINIFEHNTPLHDGAVIIRGNRVAAATCYLPLSENLKLSKELGTRHRAAVGVSEQTDSLTIVVSEETGKISVATGGMLLRNIDEEILAEKLKEIQGKTEETDKKVKRERKGKNIFARKNNE